MKFDKIGQEQKVTGTISEKYWRHKNIRKNEMKRKCRNDEMHKKNRTRND
jgi:hypothetical protein